MSLNSLSALDPLYGGHESASNLIHSLYLTAELLQSVAKHLRPSECRNFILQLGRIVLENVTAEFVEIPHEIRVHLQTLLQKKGVYVEKHLCGIATERLSKVWIFLCKRLHSMNDRNKSIKNGISKLIECLLLFRILCWAK